MNTKVCGSLSSKVRGLMFSRRKRIEMFFEREQIVPLHTWFVFFPIKVEFMDAKKRVVERTVMRPFSRYTPKNKAAYVVETPV